MPWPATVPPELRNLIERACTPKEVEVLQLKAMGYGRGRMSSLLGISETAVSKRLRAAARKVQDEAAAQEGFQF